MEPFSSELVKAGFRMSESDYVKFDSLFKYMMPYFAPAIDAVNTKGHPLHEAQGIITIALAFTFIKNGGKPNEIDSWDNSIKAAEIAQKFEKLGKSEVYRAVLRGLYQPYFLEIMKKYKVDSFDRFKKVFSKNKKLTLAIDDLEKEIY